MSNKEFTSPYMKKKYSMHIRPSMINQGINYSNTIIPILPQENYISDINELLR